MEPTTTTRCPRTRLLQSAMDWASGWPTIPTTITTTIQPQQQHWQIVPIPTTICNTLRLLVVVQRVSNSHRQQRG